MANFRVREMYSDAIYTPSVEIDWNPCLNGWIVSTDWTSFEATRCEECNELVILSDGEGGGRHSDVDEDTSCAGYVAINEGPMMNYYYPLPSRDWDSTAAEKLEHLPVCLVQFEDRDVWALALTGGGMDLSWEICEAFMRLNFLPPLTFCTDLPRMAGDTLKSRLYVLQGARRSILVARAQLARSAERLSSHRYYLKHNAPR